MVESSFCDTYTLNNGMKMPSVGLGTYPMKEADVFEKAITEGGYRHIDTASMYANEEFIGEGVQRAIAAGVVKREDLFIVTKLWHTEYADPEAALRSSLAKLKTEYVDCYLIHWPNNLDSDSKKPFHVLWAEMEQLVEKGLTKSLGVSNFSVQLLSDLLCYAKIKPVCNQVQIFPGCAQVDLIKFLNTHNILPVAYSPCGRVGTQGKLQY